MDAPLPHEMGDGSLEQSNRIEALQLEAFEAGVPEWWLIAGEGIAPGTPVEEAEESGDCGPRFAPKESRSGLRKPRVPIRNGT